MPRYFLEDQVCVRSLQIVLLLSGIALVCSSSLCAANPARRDRTSAEDTINVVLKSGETVRDATYKVDSRFNILRLELPGGRIRNISFTEIASVSSKGRDVTNRIIGPDYGSAVPPAQTAPPDTSSKQTPPDTIGREAAPLPERGTVPPDSFTTKDRSRAPEPWLSERDESYREARTPSWRLMLLPAGNYSLPFGDYYEGIESGAGFGGDVLVAVTHQVGVWISVTKSGMKLDEDGLQFYSLDPDLTILGQEFGLDAYRYCVGAAAYRRIGAGTADRSMAYVYTGLGAIQHSMAAELTVRDEISTEVYTLRDDDTQTKFMTSIGLGIAKTLTTNVGLHLGFRLDEIWAGSNETYGGSTVASFGWIADFQGGLVMLF